MFRGTTCLFELAWGGKIRHNSTLKLGCLIMRVLKSLLIATALFTTGISSASAEVFYWQEPGTKLSVTIPDTWRMVHDQQPDDVMTFYAPGVNDFASCKLRVSEDKRFVIYPQRFSGPIQRKNFSRDFWEGYVGEYTDGILNSVTDNAALGRGFASFADASYVTSAGPKVAKRALMLASLYNDKAYVVECSAEEAAYDKWRNVFLSVAKSVNFRKEIYEFPSGHYRDFPNDVAVRIEGERPVDVTYY